MSSTNVENDIVVAGAGIAAAAVGMRLIEFGFRPFLLSRGLPCVKGIEAIPESALRFFDALELTPALQSAGGVLVEGFENAWQGNEPVSRPGRYVHVERTSLARAAIAAVIDRGAILVHCSTLPPLNVEREWVRTIVDGAERRFTAAIDATGRSARWSRPIRRQGREVAEIFSADECSKSVLRGRIAQIPGGWGYRLGLPDAVTVGVVTSHGTWQGQVNELITASLCLPQTQLRRLGRRPAFPQWAEEPVRDRRLAVGDAAIAYNLIAGQGIRFALSSTLAAVAVIRTWRDSPDDKDYATQFYRDLVNTERLKHLSFLNSLYANGPLLSDREPPGLSPLEPSVSGTSLPSMIRYSGQTRMTGLHINGLIKCAEALTLPDGNMVRWLGRFDLLTLRGLCKAPLPTATLVEQLGFERLSQAEALSLVRWCLERNILSPYQPTSGC